MPTLLERHWPKLALLLTAFLLICIWCFPASAPPLTLVCIPAMVSITLILGVQKQIRAGKVAQVSRAALMRNIAWEAAVILLPLLAAMLAGGWAGREAGLWAWQVSGQVWQAALAGILAGFAAGFSAGRLAGWGIGYVRATITR